MNETTTEQFPLKYDIMTRIEVKYGYKLFDEFVLYRLSQKGVVLFKVAEQSNPFNE